MKNTPEENERQFFRDRFDNFSSEPDEKIWTNIEPRLPKLPPYRIIALAVLLLTVVALLVWQAGGNRNQAVGGEINLNKSSGKAPIAKQRPPKYAPQTAHGNTVSVHPSAKNAALEANPPTNGPAQKQKTKNRLIDADVHQNNGTEAKPRIGKPADPPNAIARNNRPHPDVENENAEKKQRDLYETTTKIIENHRDLTEQQLTEKVGSQHFEIRNLVTEKNISAEQPLSPENTNGRLATDGRIKPLTAKTIAPSLIPIAIPGLKAVFALPSPVKTVSPGNRKPWQLHLGFAPLLTYYNIAPVRTDSVLVEDVRLGNTVAAQRRGWQSQIGVTCHLSQRIRLRAVVLYAHQRQDIAYQIRSAFPVSSVVQNINDQEIKVLHTYAQETRQIQDRQQSLGLRLDALYQLRQGVLLRHYLIGGIQGAGIRTGSLPLRMEATLQAGYGMEIPAGRRIGFWAEPTFRYSLSNRFDPLKVTRFRPYGVGLQLGMSVRMNR